MAHMIVETVYDPPATDEDIDASATKLDPCLQGHDVRWVRSYMSLDRKRRVCVFEAPDADAVRSSYRSAGVRFERVWAAEEIVDRFGLQLRIRDQHAHSLFRVFTRGRFEHGSIRKGLGEVGFKLHRVASEHRPQSCGK